ncbi:hypothetical protein [Tengunoibacter tsumagoiensis]|uniref:Uncharacterized protein n=1 Tax=Tengunoibacter tsumagoiensis TaxID=2014871 RepID=A0A402A897_9CHLR|nr:hypothetical protein [Tengunoibacter tsumagoiensis]GCE15225.1 hypothetical protein KTT_50840 [Tengunoibacter tsumagoiensis]
MYTLVFRLIRYLVSQRWGMILLGSIVVIVGIIIGLTSRQVTYQTTQKALVKHYLYSESGDDKNRAYVQLDGDSALYFLDEKDFTPALSSSLLSDHPLWQVTFDPEDTTQITATAGNTGTHLDGTGAHVAQIVAYDENSADPKTYQTSGYAANPHGSYQNNWLIGGGVMLLGLILASLAFILPHYRKKPALIGGQFTGTPVQGFPAYTPNPGAFSAQPQQPVAPYPFVNGGQPSSSPNQQYPNQQYPNQQYPNQQYPNQQYPNQQYPNQQYPNQQYPNQQYPNQQYPNQQYPNQQYPNQQYPNQ